MWTDQGLQILASRSSSEQAHTQLENQAELENQTVFGWKPFLFFMQLCSTIVSKIMYLFWKCLVGNTIQKEHKISTSSPYVL